MMNWFMEQTTITTILCMVLLLSHRQLLAAIGAHYTYLMWGLIPLNLLVSLLIWLFPDNLIWFSEPAISLIEHYQVIASDTLKLSTDLVSFLFLEYIYFAVIFLFITVLTYQQRQLVELSLAATELDYYDSKLKVLAHSDATSPMLVGLIKPCILVPKNFSKLEVKQQQAIIEHESYHYQRGDLWCNLIGISICALFWFNPLVWMAYRRFRLDQELSCDAKVTESMSTENKIAYSHALLAYSQHAPSSMLHTHYGDKNILKERILQMKKQHGKNTLVMMGLTLALGLGAISVNQQVHAGSQKKAQQKVAHVMPIKRIDPIYPVAAAKEGQNGYVQLEFDINPKGKVSNVVVIKASPRGVFDKAAIDALNQWVYQSSSQGVKASQVQLDFVIDEPAKN
ncbi:M56 family metallopeptidase [Shewanella sp. ENK2]|uniref:M56 family metallopeptidase n=1 Tax=Shewanella sp. ENK2 TaxID=2775245 RepID=UPI0037486F09